MKQSQLIVNNHNIIKPKTPSNGTCLGEPLGGFCVSSFIDDFYLYLISRLLCHVTGTPPWLLRLVKVCTSSELYPSYNWLPFLFHLPLVLRFWVGIFYPQSFFTLRPFPTFLAHSRHFDTTCFYQGFTGSQQLLSWKLQGFILILETQTQPICLFDSQ